MYNMQVLLKLSLKRGVFSDILHMHVYSCKGYPAITLKPLTSVLTGILLIRKPHCLIQSECIVLWSITSFAILN